MPTNPTKAEELIAQGRVREALSALMESVRDDPANPDKRVFLFQLLALTGQWNKALTQLNVAAELNPVNELMAQACRPALEAEAFREMVHAGKRAPLIFGEPAEWVGKMVQANQLHAEGHHAQAADLRAGALEDAPAIPGEIGDAESTHAFDWIADADNRLGPMFEGIIEGRYYWIPMQNIAKLTVDPPKDLRDVIWLPVTFTWTNGGEVVSMLSARYPGAERSEDDAIVMGRRTDWIEVADGVAVGHGQRLLATQDDDFPMLAVREITWAHEGQNGASAAGDGDGA